MNHYHQRSFVPRMGIAFMALLGLFDAAYLSLERLLNGGALACPIGGGCTTVQSSSYALLGGVPVAFLGVAAYAALLLCALLALHRESIGGVLLPLVLLVLASVGAVFSLYLMYLQVAVIGAICFWCAISAICEGIIWVCALADWRAYRRVAQPGWLHA